MTLPDWPKVQIVDGLPLAWGWSGDRPNIEAMDHALRASAQDSDWTQLAERLAEYLANENGKRIRRMNAAQQRADPALHLTTVLLAGWWDKKPRLAELGYDGSVSIDGKGFAAIGSGEANAFVVHEVLQRQGMSGEPLFRKVMSAAIPLSKDCGLPAHVFRMDAKGATAIDPVVMPWE